MFLNLLQVESMKVMKQTRVVYATRVKIERNKNLNILKPVNKK